jgi:hypothetical protein
LRLAHGRNHDLGEVVRLFWNVELIAIREEEVTHFLRRDGDLRTDLLGDHFL